MKLHLLILEDNPADAELAIRELKKEGFVVEWSLVDTEEAFREALDQRPKIILADYTLPSFDGLSALKIKQEIVPEIPLVILSGNIGEEIAVECIKSGATDYVLKDKLFRLGPVVKRSLAEAQVHRERREARESLQESEERYRNLIESTYDLIQSVAPDSRFLFVNRAWQETLGYTKVELPNINLWKIIHPQSLPHCQKIFSQVIKEKSIKNIQATFVAKDGSPIQVEGNVIGRYMGDKLIATHGFFRDITERKQAEENVLMLQSLQNAISKINQLLVRVKDESELFQIVCNILIKVKYIKFAWIGLTNKEDFTIKPVAQAGLEEGYLSSIKVTWDDSEYGNGPTGIALKTFQPFIMRNIEHDPKFKPWRNEALKRGYLSTIALPLIYEEETIGVLNVYSGTKETFGEDEVRFLKEVTEDIAIGIRSLRSELQLKQSYQKLERAMKATIETISKIVEAKDPYTAGHQRRVSQLATAIAKELNFSEDKVEGIRIASLIHDIGKIGLPTEILSKPTTLTDIEFSLIKGHSQMGYDILKSTDFSHPVARIVLQHHERLNGSGYPNHLRGDEILLEARILGVVDVVEAMSSHRPYRPALGIDKALEEISQNKGILYDPKVVEACLKLFKEKGFKFE